MKNYAFKLPIAIFVVLGIFILNSTVAAKHCSELVWEGDYEINSIEDLEALSGYTEVTGGLRILYSNLPNLDDLECLASVGGLSTRVEDDLPILKGLDNLKTIGGSFSISTDYNYVEKIEGFNNLESIGDEHELFLIYLPDVKIEEFNKLKSIFIGGIDSYGFHFMNSFKELKTLKIFFFDAAGTIEGGLKKLEHLSIGLDSGGLNILSNLKKLKSIDHITSLSSNVYFNKC